MAVVFAALVTGLLLQQNALRRARSENARLRTAAQTAEGLVKKPAMNVSPGLETRPESQALSQSARRFSPTEPEAAGPELGDEVSTNLLAPARPAPDEYERLKKVFDQLHDGKSDPEAVLEAFLGNGSQDLATSSWLKQQDLGAIKKQHKSGLVDDAAVEALSRQLSLLKGRQQFPIERGLENLVGNAEMLRKYLEALQSAADLNSE